MARQKGIIQLEGTLGGINFYIRKGKAVARKAGGGFNGKSIKTSPTMVRVRENNSEFGDCSKVKKCFKMALHPFLYSYKEGTLHGRMMQLFHQIKICDVVSERGKRSVGNGITTAMGKLLFQQFAFTPKRSVSKTLLGNATFDGDAFTYTMRDFDVKKVRFAVSSTHFEVCLGVLFFDFASLNTKMFMSDPLLVDRDYLADSFSLSPKDAVVGEGVRFAFVGLKFYQEVNGVMYVLQEEAAVGLEVVGVGL